MESRSPGPSNNREGGVARHLSAHALVLVSRSIVSEVIRSAGRLIDELMKEILCLNFGAIMDL